ncbi:MAG: DUF1266 domain-containing protein [Oscillospiraceae bacterium]|nr:DUF1266 domain-containing protein [Oscillospiraceae bacterium]
MKRKALSLLLALTLVVSLVPAVFAAEPVTPTPPEWINEEEYVIFEDGKVYEPEYWECVLHLREHALSGGQQSKDNPYWNEYLKLSRLVQKPYMDAAAIYEKALIDMMYHKNNDYARWNLGNGILYDILLKQGGTLDTASGQMLQLWSARWTFQMDYYGRTEEEATIRELPDLIPDFVKEINETMTRNGMTSIEQFLDCGTMEVAEGMETYQWMAEAGVAIPAGKEIAIVLDGRSLKMDVSPEVKNERTMVPIRAVAEALGADVEWVQDTQQIVMTRAGVTVTMTLDSTTATIDDETVEMDVAPYATEGRTLIPARYVAEFFGQKVDWDGDKRQVLITEDKSVVGDSNLEAWALPMGAMLAKLNAGDPAVFGLYARSASAAKQCHGVLDGGSWNIPDREDLVYTVLSMTLYGHDANFREMVADVKLRSQAERDAISATSDAWPSYMWEYTEYVDEKWGDRGIMAWDLFRMSNLVQWGYTAGYVTYEEALALLEPAAILLCANFSSWDEAYENYLDGYNWWARNDVLGQDIWETARGKQYQAMKETFATASIFDDTLFQTGVIGLPEE